MDSDVNRICNPSPYRLAMPPLCGGTAYGKATYLSRGVDEQPRAYTSAYLRGQDARRRFAELSFGRVYLDTFEAKFRRSGPEACWNWQGARNSKGYAIYDGRKAQRVAFELAHGPIPVGLDTCHRCDNRGCVNPAHLFLGTRSQNMRDSAAKGRLTRQHLNFAGSTQTKPTQRARSARRPA